jgi:mRNA interferase MazF
MGKGAAPQEIAFPKRGGVYLVDFDPVRGSELGKTRPAVVLQNDVANRWSSVTIVAGITSKVGAKLYPSEVFVKAPEGGLTVDSCAQLNQVRTVDKTRLIRRLGSLTPSSMQLIEQALKVSFGLIPT